MSQIQINKIWDKQRKEITNRNKAKLSWEFDIIDKSTSKYVRALYDPEVHEKLLNDAVKGKKTFKGFASAIHRVWRKMCQAIDYDPDIEVFMKKGHDCPSYTYHVCWESMPYETKPDFSVSNEYFYAEHYWSFSFCVYRRF